MVFRSAKTIRIHAGQLTVINVEMSVLIISANAKVIIVYLTA